MAKTRKKIAEQILRMVSGGNVSDDSSIDIREVMALVDQERDSLIKTEIMGTGDFEVRGELLSKERLYTTDNSYVSLNNIPIGLPNDMGIFKVESVIPEDLRRNKRTVTITQGLNAVNFAEDRYIIKFTKAPRVLDNQYRISFTINIEDTINATGSTLVNWRADEASHKFSFNIKMPKSESFKEGRSRELSRFHTHNFVEAIANNQEVRDALRAINMHVEATSFGTGVGAGLQFTAAYKFTPEDFKINGELKNGSHLFRYDSDAVNTGEVASYAENEQPPAEDSFLVQIDSHHFAVHYGSWASRDVSVEDVARNFMDKHAQNVALKTDISVTRSGAVLTFEEITPRGGVKLQELTATSYSDEIEVTVEAVHSSDEVPDTSALFYNPISFTRMPSGGHTSSLYHDTIIKSGRRFFYIEGNKVYLYKNYDKVDALDVWYIASSSSISNDEVYPVSADFEKQIITNLVQMFTVMKQAKEDLVNDNIG